MFIKTLIFISFNIFIMNYFYIETNNFQSIICNFLLNIFKNYSLLLLTVYVLRNNKYIDETNNYINDKIPNFHIVYTSFMESLIIYFIRTLIIFNKFNIYKEILYCLFIRFFFDIFYDIIHYPLHLILHKNNFLYENIHKVHHKYIISNVNARYYNHPIDYILTEFFPTIFSILLIKKIFNYLSYSFFIYLLFIKNMNDIIGHCGKKTDTDYKKYNYYILTLTILSPITNIILVTIDHDNHHKNSKYNFSARTILFDKIFNTYKK